MIKEEVEIEVLSADLEVNLAAHVRESDSELQQESLNMVDEARARSRVP